MLGVQMLGVDKLRDRLHNMVSNDKLEQALDMGAMLIEADAKQLVRVDTGLLKASINTIKQPRTRYIGTNKEYAAAQEFGRPDLAHYGYTPYLRPAARKNRRRIEQMFKKIIEKK